MSVVYFTTGALHVGVFGGVFPVVLRDGAGYFLGFFKIVLKDGFHCFCVFFAGFFQPKRVFKYTSVCRGVGGRFWEGFLLNI